MSFLDVNRDGYVTRADFAQMAAQSGSGYYGQIQAQQAFNRMDRNQDGLIDRREASAAFGNNYGHHHGHHNHYYNRYY